MTRLEDRTRVAAATAHSTIASTARPKVYIDLTHLGRHVTGLERVSIEQFETVTFEGADVHHVRAKGSGKMMIVSMILRQQLWLPLLALLNPRATFVFPGFPPSPVFALIPHRVVMYVHDLFLITRRSDLGLKARLYMAPAFKIAVGKLTRFLVNSEKTRAELAPFIRPGATIDLYRPAVRNVFALDAANRTNPSASRTPLKLVALGTVEPRKNYTAAVRILEALAQDGHPDAELHIVGRSGWGDAVAHVANHPRVIVHGYLAAAEVKSVLESADIYLCTSHDEGLGLPLLEAQYAGIPVVAPDQPVFREVLATSGVFIDPADANAAAATIASLVARPGWRETHAIASTANVARWNGFATDDTQRAITMFAP
ncbi:MAG: glycosyltransferase [Hyphomicrobiaceae bacterium]|nr:glycosyltransferase [Hyphomicrobiaceae bacterium]